ncbi:methyltransferase domain-containing protein [Nocardiopsis sp. RSe5-2]|uniref:Methyltransferase domain-containing protein n=1 Tax=Nocardiopsis endophytica TaxID=3018445 RepID=A0ABT4TY64_9ACTN|nr:methyltransferase domain-containing protein [Nocardiopsis endophytica]MDA2809602.1 methyltransferase domain-containing protein [Nocardiopsis endophytica]
MAATQSPTHTLRFDSRLRDAKLFLREAVRTFRATGSVVPSSPALAAALTRHLSDRSDPAPLAIMEGGAGTGPVSRAIARHMGPEDTADLVEANAEMAAHLQGLVESDTDFDAARDRIRVHAAPVQEVSRDGGYDLIISGLPFANFTAEEVRGVLEHYFDVLKPGGRLSFFGYLYTKEVKAVIAPREDYLRQARSGWVVEEYVNRYGTATERVVANVPPAWIHHLRKPLD